MKKLFALAIVMMMVVGGVFAEGTGSSGLQKETTGLSATTDVVLKLGIDENTSFYEIGFSGSDVTKDNYASRAPKTTVSLAVDSTTKTSASNENDELYVYWNIVAPEGIDLELAISEPLKDLSADSPTTDTIDWQVDFTTGGGTPATSEGASTDSPAKLQITGIEPGIGSKQLTVSTLANALVGKDAATYTGTLTVRVASN